MRETKRSQTRARPGVVELALVAALSLALFPPQGLADEDPEEAATRAFQGSLTDPSGELELERHGGSFVVTGSVPTMPDVSASLECLLCTEAEVAATAGAVGTMLAAKIRGEDTVETGAGPRVNGSVSAAGEDGGLSLRASTKWDRAIPRVPLLVTGVGLAVAAAAVPFLVLDGRCASSTVDGDGDCEEIHETAPIGWSMLGAGAAVAVTGIVTAVISHRLREKRASSGKGVR